MRSSVRNLLSIDEMLAKTHSGDTRVSLQSNEKVDICVHTLGLQCLKLRTLRDVDEEPEKAASRHG